jgi:iron(III) transport system substrate-binding protein
MFRRLLSMVAVGSVIALTAGCGSGSSDKASGGGSLPEEAAGLESVYKAAQKEGQLVVYASFSEPVLQALASDFKKRYGIEMKFVQRQAEPTTAAFAQERAAGKHVVDVYNTPYSDEMEKYKAQGVWKDYDTTSMPALKNYPAEDWLGSYGLFSISPHVLYYNTDVLKELKAKVPTGWCDVATQPQLKGHIGLIDPELSANTQYTYLLIDQQCGEDYMKKLGSMAAMYEGSSSTSAQHVAAGEVAVWLPGTVDTIVQAKKAGAPVDYVIPKETSGSERFIGALKDAPHPAAAQLFMNYLFSPAGQKVMNGQFSTSSLLPNIEGAVPLPADYKHYDLQAGRDFTPQLIKLVKP